MFLGATSGNPTRVEPSFPPEQLLPHVLALSDVGRTEPTCCRAIVGGFLIPNAILYSYFHRLQIYITQVTNTFTMGWDGVVPRVQEPNLPIAWNKKKKEEEEEEEGM
jgi:hypothetical protein